MEQLWGFEDTVYLDYVCRLHKSLYVLKHPRDWFMHLSQSLMELGLTVSQVYTSLFYVFESCFCIFILIYVSWLLVTVHLASHVFLKGSKVTLQSMILPYLKDTIEHGLHWTWRSFDIHGFCDSDKAGSANDRKSTIVYCINLGQCLKSTTYFDPISFPQ